MNLSELKLKPAAELVEIAQQMGAEGTARSRKQDIIFSILKSHAKKGEDIFGRRGSGNTAGRVWFSALGRQFLPGRPG